MHSAYSEAHATNSDRFRDAETIRTWLPTQRDWIETRTSLQELADSCDLRIAALEQGNKHFGKRVSVFELRCELIGNYVDVCHFLQRLSELAEPIWCDEARLLRNEDDDRLRDQNIGECVASLSLRAPFAGKGSAAEKLFLLRQSHVD